MMGEGSPGPMIGRHVRAIREERLLSRAELAERSGLSVPGIEHLERGLSARPRRRTVEKIANALGVSVEALLGEPVLAGKAEAPRGAGLSMADFLRERCGHDFLTR